MGKYNDLDLKNWKNYENLFTDSLWLINRRDNSGAHNHKYPGAYIPQIAYQLLSRYTKKGDWVLDPFLGGGTTVIEAQRMGRNSIGIEIQEKTTIDVSNRLKEELNKSVISKVINGDSTTIDLKPILSNLKINKIQFILYHPPYWDIIKFSKNQNDISNSKSLEIFLNNFSQIIDNTSQYLEKSRYCALVIGDKYSNSELTPLGFYCMNLFIQKKFKLKAVVVKNIGDTAAKNNQHQIWRYRSLAADYYLFKHEYIFIFKKVTD
jgi:DNA modification methylase